MRYNVLFNNMPKLQLIYFNLRALCEAPRMMMHRAGLEYSYEMAWDYYQKPGTNPNYKYL